MICRLNFESCKLYYIWNSNGRHCYHGDNQHARKNFLRHKVWIDCYCQVGASAGAVPKGGPRKHIISVSTYQMVILMLFNTRERLTYEVSAAFFVKCVYSKGFILNEIKRESNVPE